MTSFPAISLDRALEIAAAFAASSSNPIDDKTMPSGEVVPKCFSGKQLADFLRSEEAGDMLVSSDAELLHVSNELIRRDVAHEIKDIGGFNIGRLSQDSKNLFRLIDDEPPSYLKKRNTLVSFISPRYPQSAAGFSVLPDLQAKYFTGKSRKWRNIFAVLSVLTPHAVSPGSASQMHFASVLVFENEFGAPSVNLTLSSGADVQLSKVLKVVSLRPGAPVLGFQSFDGKPGGMNEVEIFLEFSSEEVQNDWLIKLCEIGVFPALESPSEDSGFILRQEIADGAAQQLRYSVGTNVGKSMDYKTNDPTYTFEILGGLGEKPYAPVVEFLVRDDSAGESSRRASFRDEVSAPAVPKKKINVDMSLCTIIPRPDLVTSVSQTPTTGFGSAVELCVTKEEKQIAQFLLYFKSEDGASQFIRCAESLLYASMELNRYRKVIYLPNASAAQDSSAIKGRYLEMIRMAYVPVQMHCGDTAGQYLDYKADFAKRSLKLEPVVVDHSQPDQPKSIVLPLKGKAVTFSDVNSTDLEILHNNAAIILRFTNDLDRDAFALMFLSNSSGMDPSKFRLTVTMPRLPRATVMPDEGAPLPQPELARGGPAVDTSPRLVPVSVRSEGEEGFVGMSKTRGRAGSLALHKQGWLYKRGDFFKSWKYRYFVLRPGDLSYFYSNIQATRGEKPLNMLLLKNSVVRLCNPPPSDGAPELDKGNKFFFEVVVTTDKKRTLILQAQSDEERADWMQALSMHKTEDSSRSQVVALTNNHVLTGVDGGSLTMEDFDLQGVVGIGAWGKVFRATYKHAASKSGTTYAIKVMKKSVLFEQGISRLVVQERRLMSELLHPFILTLHGHFSSPSKLYMVLKFAEGGDLNFRMKNEPSGYFGEDVARFLIAQMILAIEYMHARGILHRDIKTENVLLDSDGYCLLADMGLAVYCPIARPPLCAHGAEPHTHTRIQVRSKPGSTTVKPPAAPSTWSESPVGITGNTLTFSKLCRVMRGSFVGTPDYLAPEIVAHQNYGPEADWWAIGILFYEMLTAETPFMCQQPQGIYLRISLEEPSYPRRLSPAAVDLLRNLLKKDPMERYGGSVNGVDKIKEHPFFKDAGFNWRNLYLRRMKSPFALKTTDASKSNLYDPVLNLERARDSISKDELTPEQHAEFDLWDDAPTLDEEEESLESGGMRSSMAVLSVSEGGSAGAAAGGGA